MSIWQIDFYRRPLQDQSGSPLWELVVCDGDRPLVSSAFCSQSHVNALWITEQLQQLGAGKPDRVQVFRPQSVSLLQAACQPLGILVEPTRRTPLLKRVLQEKAIAYRELPNYTKEPYEPLSLDRPPPLPLPENLWGDQWRFGAIGASDLVPAFQHLPIPIREMPPALFPMPLQLASTLPIPGVIIDGGRRSMQLARWLQQAQPVALTFIPGEPDGLILEAGLVDRWVLTTFEDTEVRAAAQAFRDRQQAAQGLHFLLVQPDDSGMTYTGVWLLQQEL